MYSDGLSGILSGITPTFYVTFFLAFSLAYTYHCFCDVPILSGSLYGIYSGILSDIRFDIPSGIIWHILTL